MMPLSREDIEAVNALVRAGRVDQARSLLQGIDGEKASAALEKLNVRYPVVSRPLPIDKQDPPTLNAKTPWAALFLSVVIMALLVVVFLLWVSGAFNGYGCNNFC